jgi:ribosomal protein S18 acetylase RimI-like enzyme
VAVIPTVQPPMPLPDTINLRPIDDGDLAFLLDVYRSSRETELAHVGWTREEQDGFLRSQFDLQHRYYQAHYPNAEFRIVQCGGEDIGRLYLDWRDNELRLIDIALLAQWRGQGIGSAILRSLLAAADERRKIIMLYAEVNNPVLSLYQRLGFNQVGTNGVYVELHRQPQTPHESRVLNE